MELVLRSSQLSLYLRGNTGYVLDIQRRDLIGDIVIVSNRSAIYFAQDIVCLQGLPVGGLGCCAQYYYDLW